MESETRGDSGRDVTGLADELQLCRIELAQVREEQEIDRERLAVALRAARQLDELSQQLDSHLRKARPAGRLERQVRRLTRRGTSDLLPRAEEAADLGLLEASPLFDGAWYLREHPEVAGTGLSPALHYLRRGAAQGKNPGPGFDAARYREAHPDLPRRANPLLHALRSKSRAQ